MNIKRLLKKDWELIAGILAAVGVIILKLLHLVDAEVIPLVCAAERVDKADLRGARRVDGRIVAIRLQSHAGAAD